MCLLLCEAGLTTRIRSHPWQFYQVRFYTMLQAEQASSAKGLSAPEWNDCQREDYPNGFPATDSE
jgi:hypothetical protein